MFPKKYYQKINWLFLFQLACHASVVYLVINGEYWHWLVSAGIYFMTGSIGATATFHRLLSHRSYQCNKWWEYFGTIIGTIGGVGSSIAWTAIHRAHHKYVDTDKDPHSPIHKGFLRVQFLIMFNQPNLRLVSDLMRSKFHAFMHNYYWGIHLLYSGILYLIDPMAVIYAHLVPAFMLLHAGGFINTFGHSIGFRSHDSKDSSVNNIILGILVWGEGWHNNHHANTTNWKFGEKWWQIDVGGYFIALINTDSTKKI